MANEKGEVISRGKFMVRKTNVVEPKMPLNVNKWKEKLKERKVEHV